MPESRWDIQTLQRNAIYVLILVCIALIVHEILGQHGFLAMRRQQKEVEALRQQLQRLKQQNLELEKQINALCSDPKAIERVAREQMRIARRVHLHLAGKGKQEPACPRGKYGT